MTVLTWLRSHCRLTSKPGEFAKAIAERFLMDNEGDAESVITELATLGLCPRGLPHAGMTLLVFDNFDHSGLIGADDVV